ncbi:MAG TPA: zinc-binding dehydrogenase [Steroidobacteraceae bacterium]|nr:zinc-binding dehydrogenase [Steroidobacteraceae bacterium]
MKAVVTTGVGGYDTLVYCDVPTPVPGPGEVLLQVLAAGVNNTEINTRLGWYSNSVQTATDEVAHSTQGTVTDRPDGGWDEPTPFPLIQGTDCCGRVVEIGGSVANSHLLGTRVLVRSCMRPEGFQSMRTLWMGSDFHGAFAQYVKVPATEVFPVRSDWSDVELGSIPCAYGSAENMLHRAQLQSGEHVLITGASGGVGSAAVQLVKRRGAIVTALTTRAKFAQLHALGADRVVDRSADLVAEIGANSVDLIVDNVVGDAFPVLLRLLRRGGRFVSSGAISGPQVRLDMRELYLRDLTLIGTTAWDEPVFGNLVSYIERGQIRPVIAKTFPLENIVDAQREFLLKSHIGKFVLIPPDIVPPPE